MELCCCCSTFAKLEHASHHVLLPARLNQQPKRSAKVRGKDLDHVSGAIDDVEVFVRFTPDYPGRSFCSDSQKLTVWKPWRINAEMRYQLPPRNMFAVSAKFIFRIMDQLCAEMISQRMVGFAVAESFTGASSYLPVVCYQHTGNTQINNEGLFTDEQSWRSFCAGTVVQKIQSDAAIVFYRIRRAHEEFELPAGSTEADGTILTDDYLMHERLYHVELPTSNACP